MMNKHRHNDEKVFLLLHHVAAPGSQVKCSRAEFSLPSEGFDDNSPGYENLPEATDDKEIGFCAIYESDHLKEELEH